MERNPRKQGNRRAEVGKNTSTKGPKYKYYDSLEVIKEKGLYNILCDLTAALAFKGFTLEEVAGVWRLKFKEFKSLEYKEFLAYITRDKGLRDAFFLHSKEVLQGASIRLIRKELDSGNSSFALPLLELTSKDESTTGPKVSKETEELFSKVFMGLEELVADAESKSKE